MVRGIIIVFSYIFSFLEKIFAKIKKSFMKLLCLPSSSSKFELPVSCKRNCSDTSEASKVKRPCDSQNNDKTLCPSAINDSKSTGEKTESKIGPDLLAMKKTRPMITIPAQDCTGFEVFIAQHVVNCTAKFLEKEGYGFCLFGTKGLRSNHPVMEDGFGVLNEINGGSNMDFFGIYDGHGGRLAMQHITDKLGKSVIDHISKIEHGENHIKMAITEAYLATDKKFLRRPRKGGSCAVTAVFVDGELYVAHAGDCRAVLSRKGVAIALTLDHTAATRPDERRLIESKGGYVTEFARTWRVNGSLAVTRAFGDFGEKGYITCEPEITKVQLASDCNFLVMASDGLWEKVDNQEAIDIVKKYGMTMKSCQELVKLSRARGGTDDVTVMVIDLQKFVRFSS